MAALDGATVSIFPNPDVADVVPKRTKYGDMPSDVPLEIMR
jgi:hypothetical protein